VASVCNTFDVTWLVLYYKLHAMSYGQCYVMRMITSSC